MTVHGQVRQGFESVREQFEKNFHEGDIGAAFCVMQHGEIIIDLWGGVVDSVTQDPWLEDSTTCVFSGSKGIIAAIYAFLVQEGIVNLDDPVVKYWPEFAAEGKKDITISQCLTYTAGLPGITKAHVSQDDLHEPRYMAELTALESPIGSRGEVIYGPYTMGWIADEVCLRATGATLAEYFEKEIAKPYEINFSWNGDNASKVHYDSAFTCQYDKFNESADPLVQSVWANPIPFPHGEVIFNTPRRRKGCVPAGTGYGSARSIAKLYSLILDWLPQSKAFSDAIDLSVSGYDRMLGFHFAYGRGGFRRSGDVRDGIDADKFGHDGGGGSAHFAWPSSGISLSYTPNRLLDIGNNDKRAGSLVKSLKQSLASMNKIELSL